MKSTKPLAAARACRTLGRDARSVWAMASRGVLSAQERTDLLARLAREAATLPMNDHQRDKVAAAIRGEVEESDDDHR